MKNLILVLLIILLILNLTVSFNKTNKPENNKATIVKTLYRQCARWAIASTQDNSEMIKMLHANYATGYLWAIKDIISNEEFKKITGKDLKDLEEIIISIQDKSSKMLIDKCQDLIVSTDPILQNAVYLKGIN